MPNYTIDPTAYVHPSAEIGEGVEIGPNCRVGPRCVIGARTSLRLGSTVVQDTTMGEGNTLHPYCVIGGDPQDRAFSQDNPGVLFVGDNNVFREYVTISRSTEAGHGLGKPTRIGSNCFFMACSHVGHNSVVEDNVTLTNGASIGGHCHIGFGANLSGFTHVHQFCRVGAFVMIRASAGISMHAPPYVVIDSINTVGGYNRVGLRRSPKFTHEDRLQIKEVFRVIYRTKGLLADRLERAEALANGPAAKAFTDAVRATIEDKPPYRRGLVGPRWRRSRELESVEVVD